MKTLLLPLVHLIALGMWIWPVTVLVRSHSLILALAWLGIEILTGALLIAALGVTLED